MKCVKGEKGEEMVVPVVRGRGDESGNDHARWRDDEYHHCPARYHSTTHAVLAASAYRCYSFLTAGRG